MINNFISDQIRANFGFEPTFEQSVVIQELSEFILANEASDVFLLRGFAGTGKTSIVAALVKTLDSLKQRVVLMAPTGRAAKVFALYSGHPAFTIHRRIYRQKNMMDDSSFSLSPNLARDTLFIVDEASMISNEASGTAFGSGRLLDDLFQFVYSGEGCRLLLLGDTAQLPPVGLDESPALSPQQLSCYGTDVKTMELTRVMRQNEMSGILENATAIRERIGQLTKGRKLMPSPLRLHSMPDVITISGNDLIEKISDSYRMVGEEETMIICRSNKSANIYNRGIRTTILYCEEELCSGDRIMIVKNNYFWIKERRAGEDISSPTFLANGDMAVVRRIRRTRELYGSRFADVQFTLPDYDDYELEATVLLDTLASESPSLTREENERLFNAVMEDYADIPNKTDRYKKLREDIYYNALQIKHAYAVTCHKAQGGQWDTVFIDQGWLPPETVYDIQYYRWLYTAFTRATNTVYLVNWRKEELL